MEKTPGTADKGKRLKTFAVGAIALLAALGIGYVGFKQIEKKKIAGKNGSIVADAETLREWVADAALTTPVGYEPAFGYESKFQGNKMKTICFYPIGQTPDIATLNISDTGQMIPKETTGIVMMHIQSKSKDVAKLVDEKIDELTQSKETDKEVELKKVMLPKGRSSVGAFKQYANKDGKRLLSYYVPVKKDVILVGVGPRNRFNHDSFIPYLTTIE